MAIWTDELWNEMAADIAAIVADNPVVINIRRGNQQVAAQTARLAQSAGGRRSVGNASSERRAAVVVVGGKDFDVRVGDRFTNAEIVYSVTFVRPNRRAAVVAEAEAVE